MATLHTIIAPHTIEQVGLIRSIGFRTGFVLFGIHPHQPPFFSNFQARAIPVVSAMNLKHRIIYRRRVSLCTLIILLPRIS